MENTLGKFLEELRGKLTLREVAAKSGLSHAYIRDIELGINRKSKTPIKPSPETLKRLAEAYDYPYDKLMEKAGYIDFTDEEKEVVYKIKNAVPIDEIVEEHNISVYGQVLNEKQRKLFLTFMQGLVEKE
jgi:transcriptional regulator with XRE-family HTH domain